MRPLEVTVRARLTEKSTHAHGARPRPRATLAGMSETTPPGAGDGEPSAEEIDAATRIQAMHRGRVARRGIRDGAEGAKNADAFSENAVVAAASNDDDDFDFEDDARTNAAAARIQAAHRGKAARREMRELKETTAAATKIQAAHRGRAARRAMAASEEELEDVVAAEAFDFEDD